MLHMYCILVQTAPHIYLHASLHLPGLIETVWAVKSVELLLISLHTMRSWDLLSEYIIHVTALVSWELFIFFFFLGHSLSKNPIGNEGFSFIMDALIAKPQSSLKKLGWGDYIVLDTCDKHFSCVQYIVVEHNLPCADALYFSCKITVSCSIWCCYTCIMGALWCGHH